MTEMSPPLSAITLNGNRLNSLIRSQTFVEWIKNNDRSDYKMSSKSCRGLKPGNMSYQKSLSVYEQREADHGEVTLRQTGAVRGCGLD